VNNHITKMLEHVYYLEPCSVLDIGCGFGKWGLPCPRIWPFSAL